MQIRGNEFIYISATLKTKVFKNSKRGFLSQTVDVHHTCSFYHIVGEISFVDCDSNSELLVSKLSDCVYDTTIVFVALFSSNNIQTVANIKKCSRVYFIAHNVPPFMLFVSTYIIVYIIAILVNNIVSDFKSLNLV